MIVVLGFVRPAIGVPRTPPNQALIRLALFLTFFIMRSDVGARMSEGYGFSVNAGRLRGMTVSYPFSSALSVSAGSRCSKSSVE